MDSSESATSKALFALYCYVLYPIIYTGIFFLFIRFYTLVTSGECKCKTSLIGKTVIITGANRGIGKETALELAKHNAKIIMACRDVKSAECAAKEIIESSGNNDVIVRQLDLGSFQSVRNFAKTILETEDKVDILINNAGALGSPTKKTSVDGCELTMQVNHFSHFLLVNLLLDLLKKSAPSRIINVASSIYLVSVMDLDNPQLETSFYNSWFVYANSKMANIHFTKELSRRLKGTGVTVNCLHPGVVNSGFLHQSDGFFMRLSRFFIQCMQKDPTQGAQTTIHLALAPELEEVSGKYFADCKEQMLFRRGTLSEHNSKKLWAVSEKVVDIHN